MIRDQVAGLYRNLGRRGLIIGSSGNVSARSAEGMILTPSGGDPEWVTAGDLAAVTLDGEALDEATASSEWALHAAVYRTCPDASFIVHTHAEACTALACLNQGLPAFHYMVLQFGGFDVRCAPYVTFGTQALADLAAVAIQDRTACLLANHGMIVAGRTQAEALAHSLLLESLCRQYLMALSAGTPRLLTDEEMDGARERFKTYGPRSGR